jgi:hypothetical protein
MASRSRPGCSWFETVASRVGARYTVWVVFTTVPWRTGNRRRSAGRAPSAAEASPERADFAELSVPPFRSKGAVASTDDRFMDVVVLISVLLFLLLAAGVGLLVLRNTLLLH